MIFSSRPFLLIWIDRTLIFVSYHFKKLQDNEQTIRELRDEVRNAPLTL